MPRGKKSLRYDGMPPYPYRAHFTTFPPHPWAPNVPRNVPLVYPQYHPLSSGLVDQSLQPAAPQFAYPPEFAPVHANSRPGSRSRSNYGASDDSQGTRKRQVSPWSTGGGNDNSLAGTPKKGSDYMLPPDSSEDVETPRSDSSNKHVGRPSAGHLAESSPNTVANSSGLTSTGVVNAEGGLFEGFVQHKQEHEDTTKKSDSLVALEAFGTLAVFDSLPPRASVTDIVVVDFDQALIRIACLNHDVMSSHQNLLGDGSAGLDWKANALVLEASLGADNCWNEELVGLLRLCESRAHVVTVVTTSQPMSSVGMIKDALAKQGLDGLTLISYGDSMQSNRVRKPNLISRLWAYFDEATNLLIYEGSRKDAKALRGLASSLDNRDNEATIMVHDVVVPLVFLPPRVERTLLDRLVPQYNSETEGSRIDGFIETDGWEYRVTPQSRKALADFTDEQMSKLSGTGLTIPPLQLLKCKSIRISAGDLSTEDAQVTGPRGTLVSWAVTAVGPGSDWDLAVTVKPVSDVTVLTQQKLPTITLATFKTRLPQLPWTDINDGPVVTTMVDVRRHTSAVYVTEKRF